MKNYLFLTLFLSGFVSAFSQTELPPYKQNKNVPVFELQKADNSKFSTSRLKKNTPTVIMFFSPGCDHCIRQFEDMVKRMNDFKNYQIIMATYQPLEELAEFNKKYNIAKYPNIVAGRDSGYFLPPFYQIQNFPHFAFYNKTGKLTDTFEGNITVDNMLKKLR